MQQRVNDGVERNQIGSNDETAFGFFIGFVCLILADSISVSNKWKGDEVERNRFKVIIVKPIRMTVLIREI